MNHWLRTTFGRRDPGKSKAILLEELWTRDEGFFWKCLAQGRGGALGRFRIETFRRNLGVRLRFFYIGGWGGGESNREIVSCRACVRACVRAVLVSHLVSYLVS